jgi:hypothetical protein
MAAGALRGHGTWLPGIRPTELADLSLDNHAGRARPEPHRFGRAYAEGWIPAFSHVSLTALLIMNENADFCIRMRLTGLAHIGRFGYRPTNGQLRSDTQIS